MRVSSCNSRSLRSGRGRAELSGPSLGDASRVISSLLLPRQIATSVPHPAKLRAVEHLEGKQSVLAALHARQRRFEIILVRHDAHAEKVAEVVELAERLNVPVRRVDAKELSAMAHGATHGGVLAIVSEKPRTSVSQLIRQLDDLSEPPLLLLLEGVDDARNLGFTLRSADALGVHAVLIKKHLWDLDATEVARPASGAYERLPLARSEARRVGNEGGYRRGWRN